ncbi:MAG: GNAT family N-acetyltransferase, partial [bacterium]|nr:GNAT family N-acetyltransferase [bacterium]
MANRAADPLAGVRLRPMRDGDIEFLYRVYAGTRQDEMALTGWTEPQQEEFLRMQFHAQHTHYQKEFREAAWDVIEKAGEPIGRLYLDRRPDEIRVIDIALLPAERCNGIGGALMRRVLEEAAVVGKMV